jgi:beta-alanine degradation protein BauB
MTQAHFSQPVGSKVLFEDDRVRVWELEVAPGETFPMHFHGLDYVTVSLTEADVEARGPDGSVRGGHRLPGDVQVSHVGAGDSHELRNVGTTVYRNRIVEFKSPLPAGKGLAENISLQVPREG